MPPNAIVRGTSESNLQCAGARGGVHSSFSDNDDRPGGAHLDATHNTEHYGNVVVHLGLTTNVRFLRRQRARRRLSG